MGTCYSKRAGQLGEAYSQTQPARPGSPARLRKRSTMNRTAPYRRGTGSAAPPHHAFGFRRRTVGRPGQTVRPEPEPAVRRATTGSSESLQSGQSSASSGAAPGIPRSTLPRPQVARVKPRTLTAGVPRPDGATKPPPQPAPAATSAAAEDSPADRRLDDSGVGTLPGSLTSSSSDASCAESRLSLHRSSAEHEAARLDANSNSSAEAGNVRVGIRTGGATIDLSVNIHPAVGGGRPQVTVSNGAARPQVNSGGAARSQMTSGGTAKPRVASAVAKSPVSSDGAARPHMTAEGAAKPRMSIGGAARTQVTSKGAAKPQVTSRGAARPQVISAIASKPQVTSRRHQMTSEGTARPQMTSEKTTTPQVTSGMPHMTSEETVRPQVTSEGASRPRVTQIQRPGLGLGQPAGLTRPSGASLGSHLRSQSARTAYLTRPSHPGNVIGHDNITGTADITATGNITGTGNIPGLGNITGHGNITAPGNISDSGNISGFGNIPAPADLSGQDSFTGPATIPGPAVSDLSGLSGMSGLSGVSAVSPGRLCQTVRSRVTSWEERVQQQQAPPSGVAGLRRQLRRLTRDVATSPLRRPLLRETGTCTELHGAPRSPDARPMVQSPESQPPLHDSRSAEDFIDDEIGDQPAIGIDALLDEVFSDLPPLRISEEGGLDGMMSLPLTPRPAAPLTALETPLRHWAAATPSSASERRRQMEARAERLLHGGRIGDDGLTPAGPGLDRTYQGGGGDSVCGRVEAEEEAGSLWNNTDRRLGLTPPPVISPRSSVTKEEPPPVISPRSSVTEEEPPPVISPRSSVTEDQPPPVLSPRSSVTEDEPPPAPGHELPAPAGRGQRLEDGRETPPGTDDAAGCCARGATWRRLSELREVGSPTDSLNSDDLMADFDKDSDAAEEQDQEQQEEESLSGPISRLQRVRLRRETSSEAGRPSLSPEPATPGGAGARLLRPPRQLSRQSSSSDVSDWLLIDRDTYMYMAQDFTHCKTMLHKLRRILLDADTINPLEQSLQFGRRLNSVSSESQPSEGRPSVDGGADLAAENATLRRQVSALEQQVEEKDRTILLLQQQMAKYAGGAAGGSTFGPRDVATVGTQASQAVTDDRHVITEHGCS